jgi:hypothetical protein
MEHLSSALQTVSGRLEQLETVLKGFQRRLEMSGRQRLEYVHSVQ